MEEQNKKKSKKNKKKKNKSTKPTKQPSKEGKNVKRYALEMLLAPTNAEEVYRDYLIQNGVMFQQQVPIRGITQWWICDFIINGKYVVEIDGGYHLSKKQHRIDAIKEKELKKLKFNVIRYTNEEIMKMYL